MSWNYRVVQTKGGLRINVHGQVLSAGAPGAVIPGLYASGNASSMACT